MYTLTVLRVEPINIEKLREEAVAAWGDGLRDVNEHEERDQKYVRFYFHDGAGVRESQVMALVANHDGSGLSSRQQAEQEREVLRQFLASQTYEDVTAYSDVTFREVFSDLLEYLKRKGVI